VISALCYAQTPALRLLRATVAESAPRGPGDFQQPASTCPVRASCATVRATPSAPSADDDFHALRQRQAADHKPDFRRKKPSSLSLGGRVGRLDEQGIETDEGNRHPLPYPDRFVAYVFDDIHLNAARLVTARAAANRQLSESLRPGTRARFPTPPGSVRP